MTIDPASLLVGLVLGVLGWLLVLFLTEPPDEPGDE